MSVADALGRPVYWVGPRKGFAYEFTTTPAGRVFVRYLPAGVKVGDPRPNFLTVATYPLRNPLAALRRAGRVSGTQSVHLKGGGLAVAKRAKPTSAFYAGPGTHAQVEVYDPTPSEAMRLVLAGEVRPVR